MEPQDEGSWGINLNLVKLNTVLVFISTWGQEITRLNFLVWQKQAELGEGDADGSAEPCCSASTCLKDLFCPTLSVWEVLVEKLTGFPRFRAGGTSQGVQKASTKAPSLGLWKWGLVGRLTASLMLFSGKQNCGVSHQASAGKEAAFSQRVQEACFSIKSRFLKKRLFAEVSFGD